MIFVTLGTQDKEFTRLVKEIDRLVEEKIIKEEVIVQAGCTKYESNNIKMLDLIPHDEFDKLVSECSILITHGGVGSILTGIKESKTVIAIPRLKEYDEHESDHQIQIVDEFNKLGYIIGLKDVKELEHALKKAKIFKPNEFKSNNKEFIKHIENYIDIEEKKDTKLDINKKLVTGILLLILSIIFRITLESTLLTSRGDELLSLIITWLIISLINEIINHHNNILYNICKNSKSLLIEFILILLIIVLPGISNIIVKIIIYLLTITLSFILNYLINILITKKK